MEGTEFGLETKHMRTDYEDVGVQRYRSCILFIPVVHTACRKSG